MGPYLSIDETSLSDDELYTIVTNKEAKGRKGSIVAIVRGTKAEDVIEVLLRIKKGLMTEGTDMMILRKEDS